MKNIISCLLSVLLLVLGLDVQAFSIHSKAFSTTPMVVNDAYDPIYLYADGTSEGLQLSDIVQIAVPNRFARATNRFGNAVFALRADGTVWGWGDNGGVYLLGNGMETGSEGPIQIMTDVKAITSGASHTLALKTDGTVWGWGWNGSGCLGYAQYTTNYQETNPCKYPVQINGLSDIVEIAAGEQFSMALDASGDVYVWGGFRNGTQQTAPVRMEIPDVVSIAAGRAAAYAVCSDGTLWSWGGNSSGELGQGGTTPDDQLKCIWGAEQNTPAPALAAEVEAVYTGDRCAVIQRKDGTMFRTDGYGNFVQIPITADTSNPVISAACACSIWYSQKVAAQTLEKSGDIYIVRQNGDVYKYGLESTWTEEYVTSLGSAANLTAVALQNYLIGRTALPDGVNYDIDGNGIVNGVDLALLKRAGNARR